MLSMNNFSLSRKEALIFVSFVLLFLVVLSCLQALHEVLSTILSMSISILNILILFKMDKGLSYLQDAATKLSYIERRQDAMQAKPEDLMRWPSAVLSKSCLLSKVRS